MLDLFPARIAFVDQAGRLTPEAYRALDALFRRVGGSFGDQGEDTFSLFSPGDSAEASQSVETMQGCADVPPMFGSEPMQREEPAYLAPIMLQLAAADAGIEMVMAPETTGSPVRAVTVGASPFAWVADRAGTLAVSGGTVTAITLTRAGTTAALGILAGAIPVSTGDTVTTTYAVAPTISFIPR
jgi:hypothetical protein